MKLPNFRKLFFIFSLLFFLCKYSFCQNTEPQAPSVSHLIELSEKKRIEGDIKEATRFLNEAAIISWENKKYDEAIEYFSKSSTLNQQINNESGIDKINSNLGMIYSDLLDFDKSLNYFEKSLQYRKKNALKFELISTYINISVVLNNLKKYIQAADNLEQALKLATEMNDAQQMKSCYGMLAETYEKAGDEAKTLHYFGLYKTFHEMILKNKETGYKQEVQKSKLEALLKESENKNKDLELQIQQRQLTDASKELVAVSKDVKSLVDSLSKNELAVALLKKQNQVKEFQLKENTTRLENQFTFIILSLSAFLLAMALLIIVYRNNKSKQKTNELLNNQNEEIKALSDNLDELVKQRTKEFQAALEKLSRRNQLWLKFSNMLVAKLGHPILGIDELVTNLEGKEVTKTLSDNEIDNLLLYLNQLNSIKSDLSEVSSLTGMVNEQLETISIPPVFTSILAQLKDAISKSDAKVTIEYNGINSVKGIRSFVENILLRLIAKSLSNNAKPSNVVITVKLLKLKGMACISISDNITIANQPLAKELTLDLVNLNDNSINGLSLILVQSQLVAMDGELEMDILPEMGMVMRIFLPLPEEGKPINSKATSLVNNL